MAWSDLQIKNKLWENKLLWIGGITNVEGLTFVLDYKVGKLPTTYLFLPLEATHKSMRIWEAMELRFWKKTNNMKEAVSI